MRHFTKDEQKKYTESISKLCKPTGASIMTEEKVRKEAEFVFSKAADTICGKLFMFRGDEFDYEEGLKAINVCTWVLRRNFHYKS